MDLERSLSQRNEPVAERSRNSISAHSLSPQRRPMSTHPTDPSPFSRPKPAEDLVLRHERIERAAYLRAVRRGFEPGHELEDWLAAEKEIDQDALQPTGD
jgi:hypothetical protein